MSTNTNQRLLSLDALRGFDMLLISGGGTFLALMENKTEWGWVDAIARQLHHPAWNGFTFYDFIMPLFLFIAGVSLTFSIRSAQNRGFSKTEIYRKVFIRMIILMLLGYLFKNAPVPIWEPSQIRFSSVLGRIGFAVFITTLVYLNFEKRGRLLWIAGILLSYYAMLYLIPVPGYGAGDLSFEGNLVGWIDRTFMPGRLLQGTYDELALLTELPSMCLTMMGAFAGDIIGQREKADTEKAKTLLIAGIIILALGLLWSLHFPINKHLWTSSFILLTGGMAFLFLCMFYWIIEINGKRKWAFFFKVIGMNSLLIYLANGFIDFGHTSHLLFSGLYAPIDEKWHDVLQALGSVGLVWLFLYFMYRQKVFLKV